MGIARVVFRDAGSNDVGSTDMDIMDNTAPLGTWTRHTLRTLSAPAGTASANVYILFVSPSLMGGAMWVDDIGFRPLGPTDVAPGPAQLRSDLHQNVPNPFNPTTQISFDLAQSGRVALRIYDVAGRLVRTMIDKDMAAGRGYKEVWSGLDDQNQRVASGVYFYRLDAVGVSFTKKMVVMK